MSRERLFAASGDLVHAAAPSFDLAPAAPEQAFDLKTVKSRIYGPVRVVEPAATRTAHVLDHAIAMTRLLQGS
jgi:hypothetical protein